MADVWRCSEGCESQHNTDVWKQKQNVWKHIALKHTETPIADFRCKICHDEDQREMVTHKFKFRTPYETYNHLQEKHKQDMSGKSAKKSHYENILAMFNGKLCKVVKEPQEKWFVLEVMDIEINSSRNNINISDVSSGGSSSNSSVLLGITNSPDHFQSSHTVEKAGIRHADQHLLW